VRTVVKGTVTSVRPFGIFVKPSGKAGDGLVHCTQVSDDLTFTRDDSDDAKVMAMEYFFPRGSEVFCKVLDVEDTRDGYADHRNPNGGAVNPRPPKPKVSLSIKLADQETGEDLDPTHSQCGGGAGRGGNGNNRNGGGFEFQSDDPPDYGTTHKATVSTIKGYGVFCKPNGFRRDVRVGAFPNPTHLRLPIGLTYTVLPLTLVTVRTDYSDCSDRSW
jgi:hypothetical protein|tara:strand:- start:132 stop:782 length:651 start_codon:yes stop_codon:yes gene_type:complete